MRQATLARGRLAEHPVWSRALANPDLVGRVILPVVVGSAIEDREKVEAAPWPALAEARAGAGAAPLIPRGMREGSVRALRVSRGDRRSDSPSAWMVKLKSSLYGAQRAAGAAAAISERAVPLLPADDAAA